MEPLSTTYHTPDDATLTVRLIKSFPYRTVKNLILRHVDLTKTTVGGLKDLIRSRLSSVWMYSRLMSCLRCSPWCVAVRD